MTVRTAIGAGACALTVAALGLGFSQIGSPAQNRARAADARTQQAISDIANETTAAVGADVTRTQPRYPARLDADVRRAIRFENRSSDEYALCATFSTAGNAFAEYGPQSPSWTHPAGRHCYRFRWVRLASEPFETVPL